jgi:hypothetical protein
VRGAFRNDSLPAMLIKAVSNIPAAPPPMNVTKSHQKEDIMHLLARRLTPRTRQPNALPQSRDYAN